MSYTVAFTGDVAFSGHFSGRASRSVLDESLCGWLSDSDLAVANIEAPITEQKAKGTRTIEHTNPPACASVFRAMHFGVWNIGNNHILDCENQGLADTLAAAAEEGIPALGAGMNREEAIRGITVGDGVRVALLSVTMDWPWVVTDGEKPGTISWKNTELIRRRIAEVRRQATWVVVCCHAGLEFAHLPMPYLRRQYRELLEAGADIVVGHHPHVVQPYEFFGKKAVFYSLGNFIFDTDFQRCHRFTDRGVLLKITFEQDNWRFDAVGSRIDRDKMTVCAEEIPAIFSRMDETGYQRAWPLAARKYLLNRCVSSQYFHPDREKWPAIRWMYWVAKQQLRKGRNEREVLWGALRSCFHSGGWRNVPEIIRWVRADCPKMSGREE